MLDRLFLWFIFMKSTLPTTMTGWLWYVFGISNVILGVIGAALPGSMPTVPFLLLAAIAFSKSSPVLYEIIKNNKLAGPTIRRYEENKSFWNVLIPKQAKKTALISLAFSYVFVVGYSFFFPFSYWLLVLLACFFLTISLFIVTRSSE